MGEKREGHPLRQTCRKKLENFMKNGEIPLDIADCFLYYK